MLQGYMLQGTKFFIFGEYKQEDNGLDNFIVLSNPMLLEPATATVVGKTSVGSTAMQTMSQMHHTDLGINRIEIVQSSVVAELSIDSESNIAVEYYAYQERKRKEEKKKKGVILHA